MKEYIEGEKELEVLLKSMKPELQQGEFVFCSVDLEVFRSLEIEPRCIFWEIEGVTLILPKEEADTLSLKYRYVSRMITLNIHSNLEAVGFLAAITSKLASHGMSVNPVSAYYHDHLFVASKHAEKAMELLQVFSQ